MEDEHIHHRMGRRCWRNKYSRPGVYHVTIQANEELRQPLGRMAGDLAKADGEAGAPHVELSAVGLMVEEELTRSITAHYPFIEVQDYVVMPEHLHFILAVHQSIISVNGRETHLGQVIAGFKKGCNRRFWEITGLQGDAAGEGTLRGEPADAADADGVADADGAEDRRVLRLAVHPQAERGSRNPNLPAKLTPSWGTTGRQPLFAAGYVDVMPLNAEQLETQRRYIHNNPRSRMQRSCNRAWLQTQRGSTPTALSLNALRGYLQRECAPSQFNEEIWQRIVAWLMVTPGTGSKEMIVCDSYGNGGLMRGPQGEAGDGRTMQGRLLPVVCHRREESLFPKQMERCMRAAEEGAVLVSARIAPGEMAIMDEAIRRGYSVVLVQDNGFGERYHPSERLMGLCASGVMLLLTPWQYHYRPVDSHISVSECKTMNCVVQALCRLKDSWWRGS